MKILAHRGLWTDRADGNSEEALRRALEAGYGVETDVRDRDGKLVIAHDVASPADRSFDAFLQQYVYLGAVGVLAINIKADGLVAPLQEMLERFGLVERAFVFDMSVPDMLHYLETPLRTFSRRSEIEPASAVEARSAGVWLDFFSGDAPDWEVALETLRAGRDLAVVSPELHGKPYRDAWIALRRHLSGADLAADVVANCMLCTDHPAEADEFFNQTAEPA